MDEVQAQVEGGSLDEEVPVREERGSLDEEGVALVDVEEKEETP